MATMKHIRGTRSLPWRWVLGGVGLAFVAFGAWKGPGLRRDALTGASIGARVACSCRYVQGRDLAQCAKDFEPGMEMISLSENSAEKSVTARFPLLASQTATFQAGAGCVLEKWVP
jgi:hypothetical protein